MNSAYPVQLMKATRLPCPQYINMYFNVKVVAGKVKGVEKSRSRNGQAEASRSERRFRECVRRLRLLREDGEAGSIGHVADAAGVGVS
jgi:hypothetical protein